MFLSQTTPLSIVRDLRKRKGLIDDLTTEFDGGTFYNGMALERVDNLPYMAYKKQLNATSEDMDPILVMSGLFFKSKY